MSHMTTVESVVTTIGLTDTIVYDIYDLYDYVKKEKLNYFTVSMLMEICTFLELPNKSRDPKAFLMSKKKEMTHECQCSVYTKKQFTCKNLGVFCIFRYL